MNKSQAKELLVSVTREVRAWPESRIRHQIRAGKFSETRTWNGSEFNVSIEVWDASETGETGRRVWIAVDDGGFWSTFKPVSESFLL